LVGFARLIKQVLCPMTIAKSPRWFALPADLPAKFQRRLIARLLDQNFIQLPDCLRFTPEIQQNRSQAKLRFDMSGIKAEHFLIFRSGIGKQSLLH